MLKELKCDRLHHRGVRKRTPGDGAVGEFPVAGA